ncbi:ATP-binding protein [Aquihabitans sp. McL0605]|uniref:ATP-binding protein n=1 Tax=Aquihabitans sp. McL0605 TaxID=3415671 RepID=UPI003CE9C94E
MEQISGREHEVLELVGAHLTNAQIAARLFISVRTVESHVSSLLRKLGAADRQALAALATGSGNGSNGATTGLLRAPKPFTSFVGRQPDIDEISAAMAVARLVTLTGPGGIGKTRLALEVGARQARSDAWFIDLVPASPGRVTATVAAAVGVSDQQDRSLVDAVCDELATSTGLVLLDNAEHVLDDTAAIVDRLLKTSPELSVLVTSRESLGVMGERVVPIRPLSLDGPDPSALQLFRERAAAAGTQLTDGDDPLVIAICTRLEGIPLAIELAAARGASLGVEGVAAALDDRLRLLVGARGADARHRSLRDVLDWSHGLLEDDERAVLRRVSLFHGEFLASEAGAVAGHGLRPGEVPDCLGRLAAKSLVASRPEGGALRYRLLDTVRAYAYEQLEASGELDDTADRHFVWCSEVAPPYAEEIERTGAFPAEVDRIVDDLRAGLDRGVAHGDRELAWRLARAMGRLYYGHLFFVEARQLFEQAADLAPDPVEASLDLIDAAYSAFVLLLGDLGFGLFRAAADRALEGGRPDLAAGALALAAERARRFPAEFRNVPSNEDLAALLAQAHELSADPDPLLRARLAIADAWASTESMTVTLREPSYEALRLAHASGDPRLESSALDAVAAALSDEGDWQESTDVSVARLDLLARLSPVVMSDGTEQLDIMHMASDALLAVGELPRALDVVQSSFGHPLAAVVTHVMTREHVVALALTGRFGEAVAQAEVMRAGWERVGRPAAGWMAPAANLASMVHGLRGDADRAREWADIGDRVCVRPKAPTRSVALVRVALHEGRLDDALAELARHADQLDPSTVEVPSSLACADYEAYLWPLAAEVWAADRAADAPARLEQVRQVMQAHHWGVPCLLRAEWRLTGDPVVLARAAEGFDAIDARFEAAATRALLEGPEGDAGRAILTELGCAPPR